IDVKPYTALVTCPLASVMSVGRAKKARYVREFPSMSMTRAIGPTLPLEVGDEIGLPVGEIAVRDEVIGLRSKPCREPPAVLAWDVAKLHHVRPDRELHCAASRQALQRLALGPQPLQPGWDPLRRGRVRLEALARLVHGPVAPSDERAWPQPLEEPIELAGQVMRV